MRPKFHFLEKNVLLFTKYFGGNPEHILIEDNVIVEADVKLSHMICLFIISQDLMNGIQIRL